MTGVGRAGASDNHRDENRTTEARTPASPPSELIEPPSPPPLQPAINPPGAGARDGARDAASFKTAAANTADTDEIRTALAEIKGKLVRDHSFAPYQLEDVCNAQGNAALQCLQTLYDVYESLTNKGRNRFHLIEVAKRNGAAGLQQLEARLRAAQNRRELGNPIGYEPEQLDQVFDAGGDDALEALRNIHSGPHFFTHEQLVDIASTKDGANALKVLLHHEAVLYQHASPQQLYVLATGPNAADVLDILAGVLVDTSEFTDKQLSTTGVNASDAPTATDNLVGKIQLLDMLMRVLRESRQSVGANWSISWRLADHGQAHAQLIEVVKCEGLTGLQQLVVEVNLAMDRRELKELFEYNDEQLYMVSNSGGDNALRALRDIQNAPYRFSHEELVTIACAEGGTSALKMLLRHSDILHQQVSHEQLYDLATDPNGADVLRTLAGVLHDAVQLQQDPRSIATFGDNLGVITGFFNGHQMSNIFQHGPQEAMDIIVANAQVFRRFYLRRRY